MAYPWWEAPGEATQELCYECSTPVRLQRLACILKWPPRCKQEPRNQGSRFHHLAHDPIFIYTFALRGGNKCNLPRRASYSRPAYLPSPLLDYKLSEGKGEGEGEGEVSNSIRRTFPEKEISCMQTKYNKFKMNMKRFALFKIQQPQNKK